MLMFAIVMSVALQAPPQAPVPPEAPPVDNVRVEPPPKAEVKPDKPKEIPMKTSYYEVPLTTMERRVENGVVTMVPTTKTVRRQFRVAAPEADKTPAKPETLDEQIQRAMANHPDLRIAQLQVELAQAKLEQERQRVTQRISAARSAVDSLKAIASKQAELCDRLRLSGTSMTEVNPQQEKLAQTKRELAAAEVELNAAVGPVVTTYKLRTQIEVHWPETSRPLKQFEFAHDGSGGFLFGPPVAPIAPPATSHSYLNDFPAMLDRRITPDKKGGLPLDVLTELLTKAAGDKPVPLVRTTDRFNPKLWKQPTIIFVGATDELGSWLQQYIDALNTTNFPGLEAIEPQPKFNIYIRNYGLLLALESEAPADATTVLDYWKNQHANKRAEELGRQQDSFYKKPSEPAPPPKSKD